MATRFDEHASALFSQYLHVCRPIEWLFTCPVMMMTVAVLGGPQVTQDAAFLVRSYFRTWWGNLPG